MACRSRSRTTSTSPASRRPPRARPSPTCRSESATLVAQLIALGAVPIGKTNLDQFATGLNGTPLALRRVPQQRASGLSVGRIQRRIGAGGGARRREFCAGHRHRRLRSRAGGAEQSGRAEGRPRACSRRLAWCRPAARSTASLPSPPRPREASRAARADRTDRSARRIQPRNPQWNDARRSAHRAGLPLRRTPCADLQFLGCPESPLLFADAIDRARGAWAARRWKSTSRRFCEAARLALRRAVGGGALQRRRGADGSTNPDAVLPVIRDVLGEGARHRPPSKLSAPSTGCRRSRALCDAALDRPRLRRSRRPIRAR